MFIIPGLLISLVTFPGIVVHELAHQLFCRWNRVAILKTCYFQLKNPAGYVVHEIPKHAHTSLLIGLGPFFVNTIMGEGPSSEGEPERMRVAGRADSIGRTYQDDSDRSFRR